MLATELPPLKNDSRGNLDCFSFLIERKNDGRRTITKKAMKRELACRQIVLDKNAARDFVHLHPRCAKDFRDILYIIYGDVMCLHSRHYVPLTAALCRGTYYMP